MGHLGEPVDLVGGSCGPCGGCVGLVGVVWALWRGLVGLVGSPLGHVGCHVVGEEVHTGQLGGRGPCGRPLGLVEVPVGLVGCHLV